MDYIVNADLGDKHFPIRMKIERGPSWFAMRLEAAKDLRDKLTKAIDEFEAARGEQKAEA